MRTLKKERISEEEIEEYNIRVEATKISVKVRDYAKAVLPGLVSSLNVFSSSPDYAKKK